MSKLSPLIYFVAAAILVPVSGAWACPQNVAALRTRYLPGHTTLCKLQDRYHRALQTLRARGVQNPERVSDLLAPRFINLPDWLKAREAKGFDPRIVYNPAPKTWNGWEAGAKFMQSTETANLQAGVVAPISLQTVIAVHSSALQGLGTPTGHLRKGQDVGRALNHAGAIQWTEAQNLNDSKFRSFLNPFHKIVSWRATACLDDRSDEFKKQFALQASKGNAFDPNQWPEQDPSTFFSSADGTKKQCGYLQYADPKEVRWQLNTWVFSMNGLISTVNSHTAMYDVIWATSRIERWFISIHPFDDGNGRVSRFMMEYVFRSVGLPTPILNNFDNDLYFTEKQWSKEIGRGLVDAVKVAEACAANPKAKGCNVVAE